MVTRDVFQDFVNNLIKQTVDLFPGEDTIHIVYDDGARSHLNILIPKQRNGRFVLHILPPYSSFLIPVEQAHKYFKAGEKNELVRREVQLKLLDDILSQRCGQTQHLVVNWSRLLGICYEGEVYRMVRWRSIDSKLLNDFVLP